MSPPPPALDEVATVATKIAISIASSVAAATVTSADVASTEDASAQSRPHPPPQGKCELLGNFALFVQLALGALALLVLVFKRWRERPQRPVKVWAFDVSKQVVGSILLHIANLLMSMLSSGQLSVDVAEAAISDQTQEGDNPCSFYFLNLLIDVSISVQLPLRARFIYDHGYSQLTKTQTTMGIPILIFFLHLLTKLFLYTPFGQPPQSIESGKYGSPPKASWWAKQSLIYFLGLLGMKFVVLLIFVLFPWISHIGDWALRWTEGNERLQVGFVMLFFPVVMNATQYYIIDTFIKGKLETTESGRMDSDDDDSGSNLEDEAEGLLDQEAAIVKHKSKKLRGIDGNNHYNEERDGAQIGSGGSSRHGRQAKLMTESESADESEAPGKVRR